MNRCSDRVDVECAREDVKEQRDICYGACHRSDGTKEGEGAGVVGEVACRGNATGGGF